jgi:CDP-paratose 2-epimerase
MKILITGICGFAGSAIARELKRATPNVELVGIDNLSRPGSELNRGQLQKEGIRFIHGDVRNPSDIEALPRADWVIDAAANPSVLAGVDGQASSRQLMEHNLGGTLNLLEYCKRHAAGFIILSTSRVYSLKHLCDLPTEAKKDRFVLSTTANRPDASAKGITEQFPTSAPVSLYGSAKLASEILSLEYGAAFGFPVFINRCGVLAGAGQFGKADQGIFSFWIHSFAHKKPLNYIGFDGKGRQIRDCLHPRDLAELLLRQMNHPEKSGDLFNVSGGAENSMSLAELTAWCEARFGKHPVSSQPTPRKYDVPWLILDSSRAQAEWQWQPKTKMTQILDEIAVHAEKNPGWLEISSAL